MFRPAHLFAMMIPVSVLGQSPYPPHLIQNVDWTDGIHNERHSQPVISPGDASLPVSTTGTSTTDFVSGVTVHLTDGFHAGDHSGDGQFHAYIDDGIGSNEDIAIIAPDASHVIDNVLHVEKWEKLEIGLVLPQEYQDAIQRFFDHYYSNSLEEDATTDLIDPLYDLNPYADDSLQLVMTLTKPNGTQTLKWGFYMKEAKWESMDPTAVITGDPNSPLDEYRIRFRFAPDMEGIWQYSIALKAPHTMDPWGSVLPAFDYINYNFVCDPPLPDNKGHLRVNEANRRTLKFETGDSFFGLGVNLADARNELRDSTGYRLRDHNLTLDALSQLHEVGGNFARMWLNAYYTPEWVNLGVYDHYRRISPCTNGPTLPDTTYGNGQYQSWCFDRVIEKARKEGIYIQFSIEQGFPAIAGEVGGWGNHPLVRNLVEPSSPTALYDVKEFFYQGGDPANKDNGAFYFWKRKYKYILSRWGYSVNIAAIEPFNEIDQLLTYRTLDTQNPYSGYTTICNEHRMLWVADPELPCTVDQWLSDIIDFVRDSVDLEEPITSPLGENKALFLMSYAYNDPWRADRDTFYCSLNNPKLDLMDAHFYMHVSSDDEDQPDVSLQFAQKHATGFFNEFPTSGGQKKPYNHGESNYWTHISPGDRRVEAFFHNYDVSFHNEIWSGAFSGRFATGTTWQWERVFWWPDANAVPPPDFNNEYQTEFFNELDSTNLLDIGLPVGIPIKNRRLHQHFKPLADLLDHPSWSSYDFFNHDFTAEKYFYNDTIGLVNDLESYYLKSADSSLAIGWVHNRNAWVINNYYLMSSNQNFLGCAPPSQLINTLKLPGFATGSYFVSWFPTRMNSSIHPPQMELQTNQDTLEIPVAGYFGGVSNNYLDTLRNDYAFIITPGPFTKSLYRAPEVENPVLAGWDFGLYPNPTHFGFYLDLPDVTPKEVALFDLTGRSVLRKTNVIDRVQYIPVEHLAMGTYWIRVSNGTNQKVKKLIVH